VKFTCRDAFFSRRNHICDDPANRSLLAKEDRFFSFVFFFFSPVVFNIFLSNIFPLPCWGCLIGTATRASPVALNPIKFPPALFPIPGRTFQTVIAGQRHHTFECSSLCVETSFLPSLPFFSFPDFFFPFPTHCLRGSCFFFAATPEEPGFTCRLFFTWKGFFSLPPPFFFFSLA